MEDEELLNILLKKLYNCSDAEGLKSIRNALADTDVYLRKNQLFRIMSELKNNGFALISKREDDYEAVLTAEGTVYCEEVLMLR